ncbi:MAG: Na+/H+ antiporter NhaA type [uncultured Nocardioidaceae bacterium]|uniref:Na(+)/H(+) antiporter NhaA n=1 Tax=uncultured Nocardioidaceae bacterium TaxID=253824 RepID=A0A6J4L4Z4_9ACTN|nr:MAG: Na+/H+ antiporter NhaA type [uncultured Nocardioidaceae bacterium]
MIPLRRPPKGHPGMGHNPHDDPQLTDDLWADGPSYIASDKPLARLVARPVREFLRVESAGSVLLLAAAAIALVWANSPFAASYDAFWHAHLAIDVGPLHLDESLQHWVNDALMVIFFFVVGLEIKYELVKGDLRDPRTAALPIVAAVGGMAVPAGLYLLLNGPGSPGATGWGIPMATDIAFAVGVLGLLGRRIPSAARLFLLTLAIADDIGAILVIAVFYTSDLDLAWLAVSVGVLALMVALRVLRVWTVVVYLVLGVVAWFALLQSGVHATLSGVAIGLIAPATALYKEDTVRHYARTALRDDELNPDELFRLSSLLRGAVPPVESLQSALHPVSSYVVLPVFALANAGVPLTGFGDAITSPVALGILLGLVVGKPLGILVATWLAVRLGLGDLPEGTSWTMVLGLGMVAGIGFTVSLFIAQLSFPSDDLTSDAKIGILVASAVAAVLGVLLLLLAARREGDGSAPDDDRPEEAAPAGASVATQP